MNSPVRLCDHRTPPRPGAECLAACWSKGRACKTCLVECPRRGFTKRQADSDNQRLVRETLRGMAELAPAPAGEEG